MSVAIFIPGPLTGFTGGRSRIEVESPGKTLGDVLAALFALYPGIRDRVLTEQGTIREHVNLFVGNENARSGDGLATPVADGGEIWIIPAISGGSLPIR
jgi:molybdopterin converting factor small subunit